MPLKIRRIKLNTNVVVLALANNASIGGVFRDTCANWLCGFARGLLEFKCDNALLVETLLVGGAVNSKMLELRLIHQL
ncbi:hypothetical protein PVK06_010957 [Gossypium arboreum]|uniref:Uncharacterized protein n=1 Tax=Gossypium arboreum TaxID=29729 RepID=A0ABR0Q7H2_GOSAR|nr:hypothetical protein PVK06_010957 [Gossypium arboreum]